MKLHKKLTPDVSILMALYLIYLMALTIMSSFTSPLYPNLWGDDSALFSLLGKGILHGKVIYLDLFDHKGPLIFFINALGYWIGGYNGILLVQFIFGCVSLTCLYFTAKMLSPVPRKPLEVIVLFFCVFAVFFYTFEQGNLTEEYSQPFISASIYLFVRFALRCREQPKHPPLFAFFYGIALAFLAFLRINNAATICAGILAIFVYLLYVKEYKNLLCNLIAGCLGMSVVAIPICAYFAQHSALNDMVYATFLYNLQIVGDSGVQNIFDHLLKFCILLFPIALCFLLFFIHVMKTRKLAFLDCLLSCILLTNVLTFSMANRYPHYFAIFTPVYAAYLFRYFKPAKKNILVYLLIACTVVNLASAGYSTAKAAYGTYIIKSTSKQHALIQEAVSIIPENERNSIIGYQIPVNYYQQGNIIPCYKYYTWQESWARVDPQILTDFMDWVQSEKPLWILITPQEDHPVLMKLLSEQYEVKTENQLLVCYRLKTQS